jgi:2-polyprenyl-3-methyl-5-hydroxy-6-metoxy-1,4-benzoquinol methylase
MDEKNETITDPAGFISIKKIPTSEELLEMYKNSSHQQEKTRPKNYQDSYNKKELNHINLINELYLNSIYKARPKFKENFGTLLEVGAGEGFMLNKAKLHGWEIKGVDFSNFAIKKFNSDLEKYMDFGDAYNILSNYNKLGKKFDVIVLLNILEHVIDPRKLLTQVKELLNIGGVILITVPNDFSELQLKALELEYLKEKFWVSPPEHLHYFNTKNISLFMQELNFNVIDMFSSFPIDFFLFHPGSNYIKNEDNGKAAHYARVELDLIMANDNMNNFHKLCQAYSLCGVGRDLTIIIEVST